jgi:putative ABC transport system permease protein
MFSPQNWWLRLRTLLRRNRLVHELDDELQFHLDQQIAENIARGMNPEEARFAAQRTFGNAAWLKEETRDTWGWLWLETLARNLRHGTRTLARTPGFAIAAILVMALGIGTTTALFTIVHAVLLQPLPFKAPDRLLRLYEHSSDDKFPHNQVAPGIFAEWKKQGRSFSDLAILEYVEACNLSGAGGQLPEKVRAVNSSWNLFSTLGVAPALGRDFSPADDDPAAAGTVVLSWELWQRRFAGDPSLIGRTIHLDAKTYTVIGIMPPWFVYPDQGVQLWLPVYHEESPKDMQAIDSHDFLAIGRLLPGISETQATADVALIVRRIHEQHLDNPFVSKSAESQPLLEDMVGDIKTPLYALLGATGCLLLIGCLNVASLLVARGTARRREHAIRAALGGSRWRMLLEHLTETFLLSLAGGGIGLLLAYAAIAWFASVRSDVSRVEAVHIDAVAVRFAVALVLLCALAAGLTSSFSLKQHQILSSMRESSRSHSPGHSRVTLRKWLLSLEVGLTVVLLIAAGLLLRSYEHLRSSNLGCITDNVLTMNINLPEAKYHEQLQRVNFFESLLERVRALPTVRAAGLVRNVPGQTYGGDGGFIIAEHPRLAQDQGPYAIVRWADPGYFAALGIPFLRGQTFDQNQRLDKVNEVIISESFARTYFGDEDPIGKHLVTLGRRPFKIVGVAGDTRFHVAKAPQPMMYFPVYGKLYEGAVPNYAVLAVRSGREVTTLALPIQRIVQDLDPELAVSDILTMNQIIGRSTLDTSFNASLLLAFAVSSLALAAVGLFGVLSYVVAQRTTEIAVRVALGAKQSEVLRLILFDGLRPAGIGLFLGLLGAAGITRVIQGLLYGVQPLDAGVFTAVAILLLAVAALACLLPAWRAGRLDPMKALRNE